MPGTEYERTFSIGSCDTEGSYQECPHHDTVRLEKKILIRKRAVILSIVTIFSVTTIILVTSVVHEEKKKSNIGYQDIVCQETDLECFKLLCPQGWEWSKKMEECQIMEGEFGQLLNSKRLINRKDIKYLKLSFSSF